MGVRIHCLLSGTCHWPSAIMVWHRAVYIAVCLFVHLFANKIAHVVGLLFFVPFFDNINSNSVTTFSFLVRLTFWCVNIVAGGFCGFKAIKCGIFAKCFPFHSTCTIVCLSVCLSVHSFYVTIVVKTKIWK